MRKITKHADIITILLFFAVALYIRVALPYDQIFNGGWVKFADVDAYYHLRVVDNLIINFPHLFEIDPYYYYNLGNSMYLAGSPVGHIHFFDYLLAGIIWIIGLGSPTQQTIDIIAAYFPAILGALTVIPVYFIGRELFGRWAGLLSALILTVLPGEFLGRSLLGSVDNHVAEVLFTTITMLFLILALKSARQKQFILKDIARFSWSGFTRPFIFSILTGIMLGIYFLTWQGALLFALIITIFLILQFIIEHMRGQSTNYLVFTGSMTFFIALIMTVQLWSNKIHLLSLIVAMLLPLVLGFISHCMRKWQVKAVFYPLVMVILGGLGLGILYIITPALFNSILSLFSIFTPGVAAETTQEMESLLGNDALRSLSVFWYGFATPFFFSIIALMVFVYLTIKHGRWDNTLLLVWGLVILAATLGQRRFAYYLSVNVAILASYVSWQLLQYIWHKRKKEFPSPKISEAISGEVIAQEKPQSHFSGIIRNIVIDLGILAILLSCVFPNAQVAMLIAQQIRLVPSNAWVSSLIWLKDNTPEPFGNPDYYYYLYLTPAEGEYKYPRSAYGVMSWWDAGYWILRIAHRIPNTNPGQPRDEITDTAKFFLSQNEAKGEPLVQKLNTNYIIIDSSMVTTRLWGVSLAAGTDEYQFWDTYYEQKGNELKPVELFYPEYYQSLMVRLFNFDGKSVTPEKTTVISFEEKVNLHGETQKILTSIKEFNKWDEAQTYASDQKSAKYRIVGTSPFHSSVPLEALKQYRLIHQEGKLILSPQVTDIPEVKIFEYLGWNPK